MPRPPRLDAPEVRHHGMVRGIERRAIFRDETARADFVARLPRLVERGSLTVYAWALLPNHAHRGTGAFVERLLADGEARVQSQRAQATRLAEAAPVVRAECQRAGLSAEALQVGGAAAGSPPCGRGSRCAG